jgi:arabinose-5-phosphate isomerase
LTQHTSIKDSALQTIKLQADAVSRLADYIDESFEKAVDCLAACRGKVVISGIGKSAIIAQKMVATLNSTGSPAIFLHAADAIHGDLGMVQPSDIVIIISKSGESSEIKALVPLVKSYGTALIAITGNMASYLAQQAHFVLNTTVAQEACPNNLAPTTSTTAQLVMGDAVAICLMERRGFGTEDFARYHPGGALGKRLYMKVENLYTANEKPQIATTAPVKEVIIEISRKRLGATAVLGADGHLAGIITDGDIRRMLEKDDNISKIEARDIMTENPVTIEPGEMAVKALELMRTKSITQLIVAQGKAYLGIIHLHDLLKEGIL